MVDINTFRPKTLFIGGPADGEWRTVPIGVEFWQIQPKMSLPEEPFSDSNATVNDQQVALATYVRKNLYGENGNRYRVMVYYEDKHKCIVSMLLKGYKRQPDKVE